LAGAEWQKPYLGRTKEHTAGQRVRQAWAGGQKDKELWLVAKESVAAKTVRPSNGLKRDDGWKGKAGRGGRLGRRTGVLNRQIGSVGRGQKVCYSRVSVLCCQLFFYS
jgi:hypothetical protein